MTAGAQVRGYGTSGMAELLLSSPYQSDQAPTIFPGPPGNTNSGLSSLSATPPVFPFHLSTDGNGNVRARATASGVTAFAVTDGWVWHRQQ